MKSFFAALLFFPVLAFGQVTTGFHRTGQVTARAPQSVTLQAVPNATVRVTSTSSHLVATIYSDALLTIPIVSGTVTTDTQGSYGYYIPLNYCVDEFVSSPGQKSYTTTNVCHNTGIPGPAAFGVSTLALGVSPTVTNSAACTPSATCVYQVTNAGINASTAVGCYGVTSVSPGVSFKITAYTCGAVTTQTGDLSTVTWLIN